MGQDFLQFFWKTNALLYNEILLRQFGGNRHEVSNHVNSYFSLFFIYGVVLCMSRTLTLIRCERSSFPSLLYDIKVSCAISWRVS